MCGIVGILGATTPVAGRLLEGLKLLEYRGYDSAGIATIEPKGGISILRAPGKLEMLARLVDSDPPKGFSGIGHTRWATHGAPTKENAHPHATERVAVVHNGIIENSDTLRAQLQAEGVTFSSQTDTEVVTALIDQKLLKQLPPVEAVRQTLPELQGSFALAILFGGEDDLMIVARRGSPLAVGAGIKEMYVGSDEIALSPFATSVAYLHNGDMAVLTRTSVTVYDQNGSEVTRPMKPITASAKQVSKGEHPHYMRKEIAEQPDRVMDTLSHYVDFDAHMVRLETGLYEALIGVEQITLVACGTSFYAAEVARYWFEQYAQVPVTVDIGSEFRYRKPVFPPNHLVIVVSQSGETADTLASLEYAKSHQQPTIGIVNVAESNIARTVDTVLHTYAGREIGVASTKAFTCQLAVLAVMAIELGWRRNTLKRKQYKQALQELATLPRLMNQVLELDSEVQDLAKKLYEKSITHLLFLGRGTAYPLSKEGALKFTEITYLLAQGYPAGELKHGPIATVDEHLPVIVLAPSDGEVFEKTLSNVEEVRARKGNIILFTDEIGRKRTKVDCHSMVVLPTSTFLTAPFLYVIPLQLLAYHMALLLGTDIDQPRNLAKSVTVE